MRLIDADNIFQKVKGSTASKAVKCLAEVLVATAPTVDAVAVTRCKDCAYGDPTWAGYVCNCNEYAALESTLYHDENFFCAYGEPKEDDCANDHN